MEGFVPKIIECKEGFYAYEFVEGEVLYEKDLLEISDLLFSWLHNNFWKAINLSAPQLLDFTKMFKFLPGRMSVCICLIKLPRRGF